MQLLLSLFVLATLSACADHSFSELETKPLENGAGDIEDPVPEEPVERPPKIVWVQVPNGALGVGDNVTVIYDVIPGSSPVVSIDCKVDGKKIPCEKDGGTLVVNDGGEGLHNLEIVVVDQNELQDAGVIHWELYEKFQKVKMPLMIADEDDQVDVLFVIDNSGSMADEQKNMADRINTFMNRLGGLDWRMGIVTTDFASSTIGNGKLLKYPNGSYYITSSLSLATAKDQFGKTIQRKEKGDANEQGIRATYRAIERAMNPKETIDQQHKNFFRKQAALAVVVISDENETGTAAVNKGANLVKLVQDSFGKEKMFKFHSIVVRPNDTKCYKASIDHRYGTAYAELTALTGGILGDICAADYGNQLSVIGQDLANTKNTFKLLCVPKDINNDGIPDVTVSSVKGLKIPNFQIKGDEIVFSTAPVQGTYSIDYFCPKK